MRALYWFLGVLVPHTFFCFFSCNYAAANTRYSNNRVASTPYISGDTFRAHADFIVDETNIPFFPEDVYPGSTIFLKTDYLSHFFNKLHPLIRAPYVLITHNSDYAVPENFSHMLEDDKLLAWFGQNVENFTHPKLHPIPIGLANKHWAHGNTEVFASIGGNLATYVKIHLLYMNFAVNTAPQERSKVYKQFIQQPFCATSSPKDLTSYLMDLAQSKFVLSPRGNGLDCHRTWEALYMGAIPIVRTSTLDPLFEDLPVLIINDWSEITDSFLLEKYQEMQGKTYQLEKLYSAYWIQQINSFKDK